MNQRTKTDLQRLLDAFRHARYPGGYPSGRDKDALAKRLMAEFRDWCSRQGLATALEKAEEEAALLEASEELENAFAELAAEGKARSICVPKADGTVERRWSLTSKESASPQPRPESQDKNLRLPKRRKAHLPRQLSSRQFSLAFPRVLPPRLLRLSLHEPNGRDECVQQARVVALASLLA